MRKQSPMYSFWATMVITRNADCNNQTYQLCAKKPKKFMREKTAEKNSWRWLQECRLQHKHTNHVQKKSYVLLIRENTLAEEKASQHCVEGNQSCAEESCTHPPICLLNPKSPCIIKVSGRCISPYFTSGVWRSHLCQITQISKGDKSFFNHRTTKNSTVHAVIQSLMYNVVGHKAQVRV